MKEALYINQERTRSSCKLRRGTSKSCKCSSSQHQAVSFSRSQHWKWASESKHRSEKKEKKVHRQVPQVYITLLTPGQLFDRHVHASQNKVCDQQRSCRRQGQRAWEISPIFLQYCNLQYSKIQLQKKRICCFSRLPTDWSGFD